jgi:hypothetical protein
MPGSCENQIAHDEQDEHDPPVHDPHPPLFPAITLPPLWAKKTEIERAVLSLPQFSQAMDVSASDMLRSASKRFSQSLHSYSYIGIPSSREVH